MDGNDISREQGFPGDSRRSELLLCDQFLPRELQQAHQLKIEEVLTHHKTI